MNILAKNERTVPMHPVLLIARAAVIETLRRRDLYVLLILSLLFVMGIFVVVLVGVENPPTANFLLNLGMSLAFLFAQILTLATGLRHIPGELENKTIYPLLAKPLKKSHYLLGKWIATSSSGLFALCIFLVLGYVPVPKMQDYNSILLLQTIALYGFSLLLLSSVAIFLSLVFPKAVNLILLLALIFAGGKLMTLAGFHASSGIVGKVAIWAVGYIPNFSLLNLTTRYTDGIGALSPWEFLGLLIYASIFTMIFLMFSVKLLKRRSL